MTTTEHNVGGANTDSAEISAPRPKRRRSQMSPSQKRVLVIMAALAIGLGLISDAAPTGHAVIDGLYRVFIVVLMMLAGSRARRWTLVVASAICAAASIGIPLIAAIAALGATLVLAVRDERDRIYGAVVGLLVGYAVLGLTIDWFIGSSLLIGVGVVLLVSLSGYKVSRSKVQRNIRFSVAGAAVFLLLGASVAVLGVLMSRQDLADAVSLTDKAVESTKSGETAVSVALLDDANERFIGIQSTMTKPWMVLASFVPVVAQNVEAVTVAAESGSELTRAARTSAAGVDYDLLQADGGGMNLSALSSFAEPVFSAATALDRSADALAGLDSPWYLPPLQSRLTEFEDEVLKLRKETALAALAVRDAPAIMGADGSRRYLLLLGNPAEARDAGGHIGNWAEIEVDNGKLDLVKVGQPLELSNPDYESSLSTGLYPESLLGLLPARYPQNWGGSIDFPTDARLAAELYEARTGRTLDGVMYADTFVFASILKVTGDVAAPGTEILVTPENAAEFLAVGQFDAYGDTATADAAVTNLVDAVFERWTTTKLPSPRSLGETFAPLVDQSRLRFVSLHDEDRALLKLMGLDLDIPVVLEDDLLAVVNRNANPSKIDFYLERSSKYSVQWDPETGDVAAQASITLTNSAPTAGIHEEILGNTAGQPDGTNVTDLAIITPHELVSVTADGKNSPLNLRSEGEMWRYTTRVNVAPGETVTIVFDLVGQVRPGNQYTLSVIGQPLYRPGEMAVSVESADSAIVDGKGIEVVDGIAVLERRGDETVEMQLEADR